MVNILQQNTTRHTLTSTINIVYQLINNYSLAEFGWIEKKREKIYAIIYFTLSFFLVFIDKIIIIGCKLLFQFWFI